MKISRKWLQKYFEKELPSSEDISHASTFHAFEVEEMEGDMIDLKVLPDKAGYALSHRGIARELSAILNVPLKVDPLREAVPVYEAKGKLTISITDSKKCFRYIGALVKGVKVGPSPSWLKEALESVGQRSINNVVDATNYVMLNIGQPLHAFDAGKLSQKNGVYAINVRLAKSGEKITTLTGEEFTLSAETLLITDGTTDTALGIGGVKGGKSAQVDEKTTDLIVESANFDGPSIRKTSQQLKLWTDASLRFQNRITPELASYGMRDVLALITDVAGGVVIDVAEQYETHLSENPIVRVSLEKINSTLGSTYTQIQVTDVFEKLGFSYKVADGVFGISAPFERRDITIPEDVVEEVGRIIGYDTLEAKALSAISSLAVDQRRSRGIDRIKDVLIENGFTEISTQSFATSGDIALANPIDQSKPWLRTNLTENMNDALTRAVTVAPRVLGVTKEVKLFEIGTIFKQTGESQVLVLGKRAMEGKKHEIESPELTQVIEMLGLSPYVPNAVSEITLSDSLLEKIGETYAPVQVAITAYKSFSAYPFALRDIAVWVPEGVSETHVASVIRADAGNLLARMDLFDRFSKDGRTSYAFRLVFESFERTLADTDLNPIMESITKILNATEGFQVR